jgi:murein DD-endopeptidase MepM/ murein hydrolase activator NlpD
MPPGSHAAVEDHLPPLNGGFDPRRDRHALSVRWLSAVLLMAAAAAALMLATLCSTLGSRARFAMAPVWAPALARRAPGGGELRRGDRLAAASTAGADAMTRGRVEQLDDDQLGPKPFTHIVAHLAQHTAPAVADHDQGDVASSMLPAPALPREIRFGQSQPALAAPASAYAAPDDVHPPVPFIVPPADAINLTVLEKAHDTSRERRHVIVARAGDTLARILTALGATAQDADAVSALLTPHKWFGHGGFDGGETVTVLQAAANNPTSNPTSNPADEAAARPRRVSVMRADQPERAAALSDAGRYVPVVLNDTPAAPAQPAARTGATAGAPPLRQSYGESLRDSLEELAQSNGIDRALIAEMLRLSAHDVDLEAPVAASDTVELLSSRNDLGQPELVFAALTLDGHPHRYYRFDPPDDNSSDYYDADGHSVTESLLRNPVAAGHLGDGFGWRTHPVLGDRRFHEGVDYAAPFGSPIAAAAAGVVEKIDRQVGYGEYIRIRHDFGYETTYGHISGVPHGLRVGDRVRQGQTIAFIGSTGLSTGPHLYYEVRINGRNVDPLRVKLRAGRVLDGDTLAAFHRVRDRADLLLQASR